MISKATVEFSSYMFPPTHCLKQYFKHYLSDLSKINIFKSNLHIIRFIKNCLERFNHVRNIFLITDVMSFGRKNFF